MTTAGPKLRAGFILEPVKVICQDSKEKFQLFNFRPSGAYPRLISLSFVLSDQYSFSTLHIDHFNKYQTAAYLYECHEFLSLWPLQSET